MDNVALFFLGSLIGVLSLFMILLILVQRGRGGGITGALGGAGGQSAFGSKAGDIFTRITVITATIWIFLSIMMIVIFNRAPAKPQAGGTSGGLTVPGEVSGTGDSATGAGETAPADPTDTGDELPGSDVMAPGADNLLLEGTDPGATDGVDPDADPAKATGETTGEEAGKAAVEPATGDGSENGGEAKTEATGDGQPVGPPIDPGTGGTGTESGGGTGTESGNSSAAPGK